MRSIRLLNILNIPWHAPQDDAVLLEVLDMEGVPEALVGILTDSGSPHLESDARLAQVCGLINVECC